MRGKPQCSECGEPVLILLHPGRNKRSRAARKGTPVTIKHHDLCRKCWGALMTQALAEQYTLHTKETQQ